MLANVIVDAVTDAIVYGPGSPVIVTCCPAKKPSDRKEPPSVRTRLEVWISMFAVVTCLAGSATWSDVRVLVKVPIEPPASVMMLPTPQFGNGSVNGHSAVPKPVMVRVVGRPLICRCWY